MYFLQSFGFVSASRGAIYGRRASCVTPLEAFEAAVARTMIHGCSKACKDRECCDHMFSHDADCQGAAHKHIVPCVQAATMLVS